jgi:Putative peptidoglycan binding domain
VNRPTTPFSRTARAAAALCAGLLLVVAAPASIAQARAGAAPAPAPATPGGLPAAIEPLATYVGQTSCDPHVWSGTKKLAQLLTRTYRSYGATAWNSAYACGTDGSQSEHYEGRAIDWMADIHNKNQHAAALAAIKWLLATDRSGNRFAMARRLGVMYVIYDNRMWGAWDGRWEQYNGCAHLPARADDNACHRTHVHISLSWNGALGRTTFWTKHVTPTNYGPCRPKDLNWAYLYTRANYRGCPGYATVHAAKHASATKKALVRWSGAAVRRNWHGPAVSAVQAALHVPANGSYGASTVSAVRAFQRRHAGCPVTGAMNPQTWRALLRATH